MYTKTSVRRHIYSIGHRHMQTPNSTPFMQLLEKKKKKNLESLQIAVYQLRNPNLGINTVLWKNGNKSVLSNLIALK